jgi:hypothetical protein
MDTACVLASTATLLPCPALPNKIKTIVDESADQTLLA